MSPKKKCPHVINMFILHLYTHFIHAFLHSIFSLYCCFVCISSALHGPRLHMSTTPHHQGSIAPTTVSLWMKGRKHWLSFSELYKYSLVNLDNLHRKCIAYKPFYFSNNMTYWAKKDTGFKKKRTIYYILLKGQVFIVITCIDLL